MHKCIGLVLFLFATTVLCAQTPVPGLAKPDQGKPLSARDELGTFAVHPGLTVELVACEPDVVDPVCFCFDARGDLYVVEMRGYPNGGKGEGIPNQTGRIRKLQDQDGDGYFETSSVFLDGLRFPCGITPWRDGFLVGDAPDLLFIADRSGKGRADVRDVLYTGFGNSNIQQMINGLQFHWDGWVYGCNGGNDSPVRSAQKPGSPVVQLRGMHFRFKPDTAGSLEPASGGGQYGLAVTSTGQWLTCTNSQHLRHIVLPHEYLRRNVHLAAPAVTLDIPDHGAAAQVFRVSPFEAWRVERTTRRAGGSDARKFPTTELTPGGYMTSACGLAILDEGLFPEPFGGQVLVCDPANNLIHRDMLVPKGSTYVARRCDEGCEVMTSTDTWFRPVFLTSGPEGAVYVADFYREIIETPFSLPDDIKARWNLNSRERGRIWRIKPRGGNRSVVRKLTGLTPKELCDELAGPISWRRLTAQRLLTEHRTRENDVVAQWKAEALSGSTHSPGPLHLLHEAGSLDGELLKKALQSRHESVRLAGLKLCEQQKSFSPELLSLVASLVEDQHPHVRSQLAMSLGSLAIGIEEKLAIALKLTGRTDMDHWQETALLSSLSGLELQVLKRLLSEPRSGAAFLERLALLVSRTFPVKQLVSDADLKRYFAGVWNEASLAVLLGLGRGYAQTIPDFVPRIAAMLKQQGSVPVQQGKLIRLLGFGHWKETARLIEELLQPQSGAPVQLQAVTLLKEYGEPACAEMILKLWPSWSPSVRREAQETLLSKPAFISVLLDQVEQGRFGWRQLDADRREQLTRYREPAIRKRAVALTQAAGTSSRAQVLSRYEPALKLEGVPAQGKPLFAKICASCHRLDGVGHDVGPELLGALGNKTPAALLIDLLDPHREVDPRYVNYVLVTRDGRTLSGMISQENAASLTLKRAEGVTEVVLRADLDELQATGKSLMPENLEEQLSPQQVADVISYLLTVRSRK